MHSPTVCPGLFTPILAPDGILCRLRIPGGQLTAIQLEQLAHFCQTHQIPQLQITNRANLQLRNVPPDTDFTPSKSQVWQAPSRRPITCATSWSAP
ncbi:MAG: hypothetical protein HC860_14190 [Alkalinema sp. RU_4_3]|nr:hypothetical protein [Alkalinema sp. RU_4_3]